MKILEDKKKIRNGRSYTQETLLRLRTVSHKKILNEIRNKIPILNKPASIRP